MCRARSESTRRRWSQICCSTVRAVHALCAAHVVGRSSARVTSLVVCPCASSLATTRMRHRTRTRKVNRRIKVFFFQDRCLFVCTIITTRFYWFSLVTSSPYQMLTLNCSCIARRLLYTPTHISMSTILEPQPILPAVLPTQTSTALFFTWLLFVVQVHK